MTKELGPNTLPLDRFYFAAEYMTEIGGPALTRQAAASSNLAEAHKELHSLVPALFSLFSALRFLVGSGGASLMRPSWEERHEEFRLARSRLSWSWEPGSDMGRWRDVVDYLADLDPDAIEAMCDGSTPELDREQVLAAVDLISHRLDRLERDLSMRGNTPR